ncbi:MAG: DUF4136 domain-containing protein [Flavobacteriales bacterium]|nr:DUF4136 domain-containing protein [Flavobacteriia bacterium]NCP59923.1 DUF4136 domain-containing protein [Flavobacteriales bacterium]PIV94486.1 MAG: DUF4136 domain-containing protein [Flavobacteriaceae bacterium CG17_big_fil_post_rev_8_21_14_2_50_33_15]PIY11298.1 MAG: DUF4136 domain-containing protein [Flavobacteriaceae bacterium CG_4_10_14_3_um_filter_33_47]PJB20651.1 MAG: DUF4136 domain-containing protein [Flavobacteriaceae bacterium CG_4_9_14_3_um_filter_33_16]
MKKLKQVRELIFKISNVKNLLKTLPLLAILMVITSCSSVRVATDFDKNADFNNYKTFAFFKTGIDKAEISDLDKRRILRAIETELLAKGFTKSENPDLLISLFTKSTQRVDVYNNYWGYGAWGWGGYGPGWGWGWNQQPNVSTTTEGTLFIDLIDANKKELVWQGMGTGYLSRNMEKKEERIKEFVAKIMEKYPPGMGQ